MYNIAQFIKHLRRKISMANNVNLHHSDGYREFLFMVTRTADQVAPHHEAEVQRGVDSLLQARTLKAAHEALQYLNQFMGANTYDLEKVVALAEEDDLPPGFRLVRMVTLPSAVIANLHRLLREERGEGMECELQ